MNSIDDWILTSFFMWNKFDAKVKLKVKKRIVNENSKEKKAIIFFPYWTGKSHIYNNLAGNFKDFTLVFYDYPNEIVSKNVNVSLKYIREILVDAFDLIMDLRSKGYREVILVGSSFGSNISLKLATMVKVDRIVLNMIDRTFALEIFSSPALSVLRKRLEKQGITHNGLERIYSFISPEKLILDLKKTKTKLFLLTSRNDIFCPKKQFMPIIKKLDKLKINYKTKENIFLGHVLSIYKNLYFNKDIVDFIRNK